MYHYMHNSLVPLMNSLLSISKSSFVALGLTVLLCFFVLPPVITVIMESAEHGTSQRFTLYEWQFILCFGLEAPRRSYINR